MSVALSDMHVLPDSHPIYPYGGIVPRGYGNPLLVDDSLCEVFCSPDANAADEPIIKKLTSTTEVKDIKYKLSSFFIYFHPHFRLLFGIHELFSEYYKFVIIYKLQIQLRRLSIQFSFLHTVFILETKSLGRPLIRFWCFHKVLSNKSFAYVYVLAQQVTPAAPKIREKKEQRLDSDFFVTEPNLAVFI